MLQFSSEDRGNFLRKVIEIFVEKCRIFNRKISKKQCNTRSTSPTLLFIFDSEFISMIDEILKIVIVRRPRKSTSKARSLHFGHFLFER
uniref:Uncharacterized protein n=1 Tax=Romanomermis culicivorax TaxID=13658 RepID=A0A915I9S7_ROMCU